MKRNEKIRLIKGLLRGTIEFEDTAKPEVEIWIQEIGTDYYKHFKTEEIAKRIDLERRERVNGKVIRMDFVQGKTIL